MLKLTFLFLFTLSNCVLHSGHYECYMIETLNSIIITLKSVDIFNFAGDLLGQTQAIGSIYLLGNDWNLCSVFYTPLAGLLQSSLGLVGVSHRVEWNLYTEFGGPVFGCLLSRLFFPHFPLVKFASNVIF